jgi:hypothetical protein
VRSCFTCFTCFTATRVRACWYKRAQLLTPEEQDEADVECSWYFELGKGMCDEVEATLDSLHARWLSLYLLYWYKSTNTRHVRQSGGDARQLAC